MALSLKEIRERYREQKKNFSSSKHKNIYREATRLPHQTFEFLLELMDRRNEPPRQKLRLLSNLVLVNCVTAIEIYFKSVIAYNKKWDEKGFEQLLSKEKITLAEAYNSFSRDKLTRQYIVAHFYPFQNFESINAVMTQLFGEDFFKAVENHVMIVRSKKKEVEESLLNERPDWRKTVSKLFTHRNKFVHEGVMLKMTLDELAEYYFSVSDFLFYADGLIYEKYNLY